MPESDKDPRSSSEEFEFRSDDEADETCSKTNLREDIPVGPSPTKKRNARGSQGASFDGGKSGDKERVRGITGGVGLLPKITSAEDASHGSPENDILDNTSGKTSTNNEEDKDREEGSPGSSVHSPPSNCSGDSGSNGSSAPVSSKASMLEPSSEECEFRSEEEAEKICSDHDLGKDFPVEASRTKKRRVGGSRGASLGSGESGDQVLSPSINEGARPLPDSLTTDEDLRDSSEDNLLNNQVRKPRKSHNTTANDKGGEDHEEASPGSSVGSTSSRRRGNRGSNRSGTSVSYGDNESNGSAGSSTSSETGALLKLKWQIPHAKIGQKRPERTVAAAKDAVDVASPSSSDEESNDGVHFSNRKKESRLLVKSSSAEDSSSDTPIHFRGTKKRANLATSPSQGSGLKNLSSDDDSSDDHFQSKTKRMSPQKCRSVGEGSFPNSSSDEDHPRTQKCRENRLSRNTDQPITPPLSRKKWSLVMVNKMYPRGTKIAVKDPDSNTWTVGEVTRIKKPPSSCLVVEFVEEGMEESIPFEELEDRLREPTEEDLRPKLVESEHLCAECNTPCRAVFSTTRGEWFWTCDKHGFAAWDGTSMHTRGGPHCGCGEESTRREDFWVCAKTSGEQCSFSRHIDEKMTAPPARSTASGSAEDEQFRVSGPKLKALARLFAVAPEDRDQLGVGRDCSGGTPRGWYDNLKVVDAWTIQHVERDECHASFRKGLRASTQTKLRPAHEAAVEELVSAGARQPLATANEVIVIHGTKPSVVVAILSKSLDPKMGQGGFFGKGVYCAENSVKIDQYITADTADSDYIEVHQRLFRNSDVVPRGKIYYAFVCYVALGNCATTRDGKIDAKSEEPLFTENPTPEGMHNCHNLRDGAHALVAEAGNDCKVRRFREIVAFNKDAINVKYLVALQRTKTRCACGNVVRERTVSEQGVGQRPIIACPNSRRGDSGRWEGGCGLYAKLPRCFCPHKGDFLSAEACLSTNRYVCGSRGHKCAFSQILNPLLSLPRQPELSVDVNKHGYTYDDFVVSSGDEGENKNEESDDAESEDVTENEKNVSELS